MKRADLKPGTIYLQTRRKEWDAPSDRQKPNRVMVVSLEPLAERVGGYSVAKMDEIDPTTVTGPDGTVWVVRGARPRRPYDRRLDAVACVRVDDDGKPTQSYADLVPVRTIRGVWDEVWPELARKRAAYRDTVAKAAEERREAAKAADVTVSELIGLGFKSAQRARFGPAISLSREDAERIVAALKG